MKMTTKQKRTKYIKQINYTVQTTRKNPIKHINDNSQATKNKPHQRRGARKTSTSVKQREITYKESYRDLIILPLVSWQR